jgi:hypothetical protein
MLSNMSLCVAEVRSSCRSVSWWRVGGSGLEGLEEPLARAPEERLQKRTYSALICLIYLAKWHKINLVVGFMQNKLFWQNILRQNVFRQNHPLLQPDSGRMDLGRKRLCRITFVHQLDSGRMDLAFRLIHFLL